MQIIPKYQREQLERFHQLDINKWFLWRLRLRYVLKAIFQRILLLFGIRCITKFKEEWVVVYEDKPSTIYFYSSLYLVLYSLVRKKRK